MKYIPIRTVREDPHRRRNRSHFFKNAVCVCVKFSLLFLFNCRQSSRNCSIKKAYNLIFAKRSERERQTNIERVRVRERVSVCVRTRFFFSQTGSVPRLPFNSPVHHSSSCSTIVKTSPNKTKINKVIFFSEKKSIEKLFPKCNVNV